MEFLIQTACVTVLSCGGAAPLLVRKPSLTTSTKICFTCWLTCGGG